MFNGPITAPVVHNVSRGKEQPTLKLSNKILEAYASIHDHSCQSDFAYTYTLRDGANPSSKRSLHTKVKMANFEYQARKQNPFNCSYAYTTDLGAIFIITPILTPRSADVILVPIDCKFFQNLPDIHVGLFWPALIPLGWTS